MFTKKVGSSQNNAEESYTEKKLSKSILVTQALLVQLLQQRTNVLITERRNVLKGFRNN